MSSFVEIDSVDPVGKLLADATVQTGDASDVVKRKAANTEFAAVLDDLQTAPINQPEGSLKLLIGKVHVVHTIVWDIITLGIRVLTVKLTAGGSLLGIVGNVRKIAAKIKPLDPNELLVCRSILRITHERQHQSDNVLRVGEASADEIAADLRAHDGCEPDECPLILEALVSKGVIEKHQHDGSQARYTVVF